MSRDGPSTMPCAFVVVRARSGRELPPDLDGRFRRARGGLTFPPDDDLRWTDEADQTFVAAWQRRGDSAGSRWSVDERGVTLTTGRVRKRGHRWTAPGTWARWLAPRLHQESIDEIVDSLAGQYHLLAIDPSGRGLVAGDALGYAFLFHAVTDDVDVVASDASLVAAAITPRGCRPRREPLAPCSLVHTAYHIGQGTGFAGVELLREGTVVSLEPGTEPTQTGRPAPWLDGGALAHLDQEQLLDRVVDAVADEIEAALDLDAEDRFLDLTGGKDSRLMLAIALEAGLADRCRFATFGPDTLRDVQIARQIADRFGLDHRWGLDQHVPGDEHYAESVRRFLEPTAAMVSVWHAKHPGPPTGRVRVSGTFAEILRTHRQIHGRVPSIASLARRQVRRFGRRSLDLLRPEVVEQLERVALAEITDDPVGRSDPLDLLETFFARNRTRKFWGPLLQMESDERIWPLVSAETARAAFALGSRERQIERLHYEIIRRASPELVAVPFAGPPWSPALTAGPGGSDGLSEPAALPGAADRQSDDEEGSASQRGRAEPLIALMRRTSTDNRDAFIGDLLNDTGNPAWEYIDRQATADAFARWTALPSRHRQQVFGALTAVLWLGETDR